MIAHQIICGPSHRYTALEEAQLQLAQILLSAAIRECDQGIDGNAALHRVFQSLLNFEAVKPEDHNLNALRRSLNCLDDRADAISRLNKQSQAIQSLLLDLSSCKLGCQNR